MDDKVIGGLTAEEIKLTPEHFTIIRAHQRLKEDLAQIKYTKAGGWEDRETAISVLEALGTYLSATFDERLDADEFVIVAQSSHSSLLQDVIKHFKQAKWGRIDRRLAPEKGVTAGSAHDDGLIDFKKFALSLVDTLASEMEAHGINDHKETARKRVSEIFRRLGFVFRQSRSKPAEEVDAVRLDSWEKRRKDWIARGGD